MQEYRKHHLYFFLISLFFVLFLNGFLYYSYKQKTTPKAPIEQNQQPIGTNKKEQAPVLKTKSASSSLNLSIRSDDYILASTTGAIEIIIYDDPTGAFSPEYYPRLKTLRNEFGNDIKIALRLLPLNLHKYSRESCLFVLCAGEQAKYFEAYEKMLLANKNKKINKKYLDDFPETIDLDNAEFEACLTSKKINDKLDFWIQEAEDNYVIGAPSTFINNNPYPGAYQLDDFVDSAGFEREGLRTVINGLLTD